MTARNIHLRETFMYLGGPDDDGRPIALGAVWELIDRKLLYWRAKNHTDLTELGEDVYKRAIAGQPTPELD